MINYTQINTHKFLIKQQIADSLNIAYQKIRQVQEWFNCYFITFNNASPRFVSKKAVKRQPEENKPVCQKTCTVIARTKVRNYYSHGFSSNKPNSRGYLLRDSEGKEFWDNQVLHLGEFQKGDRVIYEVNRHGHSHISLAPQKYAESELYQVIGVSATRVSKYNGKKNQGLRIKNRQTIQEQWVNDYTCAIKYSDMVILKGSTPVKVGDWNEGSSLTA